MDKKLIEEIKVAVELAAKENAAEGYELKIYSSTGVGAETLKDEISSVSYSREDSMSLRCVKNNKSGYAYSELVTAKEAALLVERACNNALAVEDEDEVPLFEGSPEYTFITRERPEMPSPEEMKSTALSLQSKTYAYSDKVTDGTQCFMSGSASGSVFINSAGLSLSHEDSVVYFGASVAVKDGDLADSDFGISLVGKDSEDELVKRVVDTALSKLGAQPVDSGKYNIIINAETMRSLLSTYSGVFSARNAFLKTTLLAGKEGEKVASDILTICDDPFHPNKYGCCPFDGEGVAVYKKNVIENGVLKTLLYNRMYANKLGKTTTGNASNAKGITPVGLYIEKGEYTSDQLLEKLNNGLYITELNGMHAGANTQSGDFSLQAEGFLVENGKKTRPVKNITLADNFYSLIKKVEGLSDTVDFGATSKYGSPDCLFSDVSVSGK